MSARLDEHDSGLLRGVAGHSKFQLGVEPRLRHRGYCRHIFARRTLDASRWNHNCRCRDLETLHLSRKLAGRDHPREPGAHNRDDRTWNVVCRCPALRKKTPARPAALDDVQSPKSTSELLSPQYNQQPPTIYRDHNHPIYRCSEKQLGAHSCHTSREWDHDIHWYKRPVYAAGGFRKAAPSHLH